MLGLLKHLFETLDRVDSVRVAKNTWEARQEIQRQRPDLILLDEVLPGESSSQLLNEATEEGIPVLLITEIQEASHSLPEAAMGRLPKPSPESWDALKPLYLDYFDKI